MTGLDINEMLWVAERDVMSHWSAEPTASDLPSFDDASQAAVVLDRLAQVGLVALQENAAETFTKVIDTLARLFGESGGDVPAKVYRAAVIPETNRWYQVVLRAYLLGAAAIKFERFDLLPRIVLQAPNADIHSYWIRATVTSLSRQERMKGKSLIGPFSEAIAARPYFFKYFQRNSGTTVNHLCRFDYLQCVIVIAKTKFDVDHYPNFGGYWNERTEPIISDLVRGGLSRRAVPEVTDRELARIIRLLDEEAAHAFFDYAGWHRNSWSDPAIRNFLATHLPLSDT